MDMVAGPSAESLTPVASLEEFFRNSVDAALATNHVVVEHNTSHYVVRLLTLFARAEAYHESVDGGGHFRPLALMLADALEATSLDERMFALQRLGDVSLFTAGFFAEGLQDRAVGLDYYVNMGGGAYRTLGTLAANRRAGARGQALPEVFAELAAKFPDLVDVLNEVRESARGVTDHDLLRLYETWLRTGSRRAGRLLRHAGVEPSPQVRTELQH